MKVNIRNEKESDYQAVEDMTRKAFYNLYVLGCIEHYLVHIERTRGFYSGACSGHRKRRPSYSKYHVY